MINAESSLQARHSQQKTDSAELVQMVERILD